jgi:hypothetical protein
MVAQSEKEHMMEIATRLLVGVPVLVIGGLLLGDIRTYFGVCAIAIGMTILARERP